MSYNKTAKANQKVHRERAQLSSRAHLGFLEKKKDYKLRAQDYQKKQKTLQALKRKALDKNPDEFYFKMVRTKMQDGVHQSEDSTPSYTEDQLKLMDSQDRRYVNYKRTTEMKKIEKMKGGLHLLSSEDKPKNKHTIFVDSEKEAKSFDPAKHFDTHPSLVGRSFNRPRLETLKQGIVGNVDDDTLAKVMVEKNRRYKELATRIEREKQLNIVSQKMEIKRHLRDKKARKVKVKEETKDSPAQYKWMPCRKR